VRRKLATQHNANLKLQKIHRENKAVVIEAVQNYLPVSEALQFPHGLDQYNYTRAALISCRHFPEPGQSKPI
jgi:hypothetical protein